MRKFKGLLEIEYVLELADEVIDAVDDEWRANFYDIKSPEGVAEMIARCMIAYDWHLSSLDGFSNQPDSNAILRRIDPENIECIEIK